MLNLFQHPADDAILIPAMEREPCVYILASAPRGTLYIGVTSNLLAGLHQHREGMLPGFTVRYGVKLLVFFEMADTMDAAISREKQLKRWHHDWKLNLIEQHDPHWEDLALNLGSAPLQCLAPKDAGPRNKFRVTKTESYSHHHILNTPNVARSGIGAFSVAEKARPSTSRVWAGSMMPSSHSRAVA